MAGNFDGSSFASGTGNFDVDAVSRGIAAEPYHDERIMRDDEEILRLAAMLATAVD